MMDSFANLFDDNDAGSAGYRAQGGNRLPAHNEHEEEHEDPETAASREDLIDQHVAYYMKHHPEVRAKHRVSRIRVGLYNIDGREIAVEWQHAEQDGEQGHLVVTDGPLRQPFSHYVEGTEGGEQYDDKRLGKSSLSQVPKGKRLSFGNDNRAYSRLEAMKVAKEQAAVREKAAEYAANGMEVPQHELMSKYSKTMAQKLGDQRQQRPRPQAEAPVAAPVSAPPTLPIPPVDATPTASPGASPSASPAPSPKQMRHGAPKYCAKHNDTTRRKKTKPQNLPCAKCQGVIQTNYVEFAICPTCSERDHRCMCCGDAAVGPAASPQASPTASPQASPSNSRQPSASPVNSLRGITSSPQGSPQTIKSPMSQQPPAVPSMNLFGMPDLLSAKVGQQSSGYASTNPMAAASPQQGRNAYASNTVSMAPMAPSAPNMYLAAGPQRR